ncbi:hypothetical protein BC567DRAFT_270146 [Phyllosticta citribraziliensis]
MAQIFGMHSGKVVLPLWFRVVRGVQVVLAIIILGLCGYGISVDGAQVLRPALILALITAILTLLPIVPLTFPLAGSRGVFHPVGSLALDSIATILWLASLTALASYERIYSGIRHYGDGTYFGYYYSVSSVSRAWKCGVAAAVFAAFELLLFLATLLFFAYSFHHHVAGTQPSSVFRTSGFGTASVTKDEEHAMTNTAPTSPSTTHAVPHATNPPYPTGNAYEVPPPPLHVPTGPARDSAVSPLHTGHQAPPLPQPSTVQALQHQQPEQNPIRFDPQPQSQPPPTVTSPKPKGRYVYQPVYVAPEQLERHDSKVNIQALPSGPQTCSCHADAAVLDRSAEVAVVESTSNMATPTMNTPSLAIHPPLPLTPDETTSNGGDHFPSGVGDDVVSPLGQAPKPQMLQQPRPSAVPHQHQYHQQQQQQRPPVMPHHARSLTLSPHSLPPPMRSPHHPRSLSITHPLAPNPPSRSASPNSPSPSLSRPGMPLRSLSALSTPTTRPKSPSSSMAPYAPLEHPLSPKPPVARAHSSNSHIMNGNTDNSFQQQQQQQQQRLAFPQQQQQRPTTSASSVATLSRFHSASAGDGGCCEDERDRLTGLPRAPPGVDFEASGAFAFGGGGGGGGGKKGPSQEDRERERERGRWEGEVEGVPRGVEWMVCRT